MAELYGENALLKIGASGGSPTTVAALISITKSETVEPVGVTTKDSGDNMTLLSGKGMYAMTIDVEGIVTDSATFDTVRTNFKAKTVDAYSFYEDDTNSGSRITDGTFKITSFDASSPHDDRQTFTATFTSSGAITESVAP